MRSEISFSKINIIVIVQIRNIANKLRSLSHKLKFDDTPMETGMQVIMFIVRNKMVCVYVERPCIHKSFTLCVLISF